MPILLRSAVTKGCNDVKQATVEFSQVEVDGQTVITGKFLDDRPPAIWTMKGPNERGAWRAKEAAYSWLLTPRPFLTNREAVRDCCIRMGMNFATLSARKYGKGWIFGYDVGELHIRIYRYDDRIGNVEMNASVRDGEVIWGLAGRIAWRPKINTKKHSLDTLPSWIADFCTVLTRFGAQEYENAQHVDPLWRSF